MQRGNSNQSNILFLACRISNVFATEFYLCSPVKTAPTHRKSATPLRFVTLFLCNFIILYLLVRFFHPNYLQRAKKSEGGARTGGFLHFSQHKRHLKGNSNISFLTSALLVLLNCILDVCFIYTSFNFKAKYK